MSLVLLWSLLPIYRVSYDTHASGLTPGATEHIDRRVAAVLPWRIWDGLSISLRCEFLASLCQCSSTPLLLAHLVSGHIVLARHGMCSVGVGCPGPGTQAGNPHLIYHFDALLAAMFTRSV